MPIECDRLFLYEQLPAFRIEENPPDGSLLTVAMRFVPGQLEKLAQPACEMVGAKTNRPTVDRCDVRGMQIFASFLEAVAYDAVPIDESCDLVIRFSVDRLPID